MKASRFIVTSYCDSRETWYEDIVVMPTAAGAKAEVERRRPYIDTSWVRDFEEVQEKLSDSMYQSDAQIKAAFTRLTAEEA